MAANLVQETKALLTSRREHESRPSIARNAGVNVHWLEKFDQGVLKNPLLSNIEKLHEYLVKARSKAAA